MTSGTVAAGVFRGILGIGIVAVAFAINPVIGVAALAGGVGASMLGGRTRKEGEEKRPLFKSPVPHPNRAIMRFVRAVLARRKAKAAPAPEATAYPEPYVLHPIKRVERVKVDMAALEKAIKRA